MTYTLPPGEYFIGDPTYFIHSVISNRIASGHYALPDGRGFISAFTYAAIWKGSNKVLYGVESGYIGIYSVDFGERKNYTGDGTFHVLKNDVKVERLENGGLFLHAGEWNLEMSPCFDSYESDDGYDSVG